MKSPQSNQGDSCSAGTYALANHHLASDTFHPHHFWGTNLVNVPRCAPSSTLCFSCISLILRPLFVSHPFFTSQFFMNQPSLPLSVALALLTGPDPAWRDEAHCGLATFLQPDGSILPLNCAGPKHVMFRDMTGSMGMSPPGASAVGTSIAGFFPTSRSYPYDQGTPFPEGPCGLSPSWTGYQCTSNQSSFLAPMQASLRPDPVPPSGIFGDPQLFAFESLDSDTETRNFSPVLFNVSGSVDLVIPPFDHGWCFAYSCQKRVSNFHTYVPSNQFVNMTFTGTPPKAARLWFPYADPSSEIVVVSPRCFTVHSM